MISCFRLKPYVKCFSNLFKMLKKLVVELKTAQSVEPDEESVDPQINRSRSMSTPSSIDQGCEQ